MTSDRAEQRLIPELERLAEEKQRLAGQRP